MTVAVKTIKKYKSEQETSDFLHEMGVMMDLMHPNIIHLYGMVQQGLVYLHLLLLLSLALVTVCGISADSCEVLFFCKQE